MNDAKISLKIMIPEQIVTVMAVDKIIAEAPNGFFCLKPRHVDFTSALKPGILYFYEGEKEHVMAVNRGILVKCGWEVLVSVLNAVEGENLEELEKDVNEEFTRMEKSEEAANTALRNLEAELIQHFIGMEKNPEGSF